MISLLNCLKGGTNEEEALFSKILKLEPEVPRAQRIILSSNIWEVGQREDVFRKNLQCLGRESRADGEQLLEEALLWDEFCGPAAREPGMLVTVFPPPPESPGCGGREARREKRS